MTDKNNSASFVIIGYGNSLRSDDGVGQKVAENISELNLPNIKSIAIPQLTPELCEPLSKCKIAIFIDAHLTSEGEEVKVNLIEPNEVETLTSHIDNPSALLGLVKKLYNNSPKAYCITIPVVNLEFGEKFSPITQKGMEEAIERIKAIVASYQFQV